MKKTSVINLVDLWLNCETNFFLKYGDFKFFSPFWRLKNPSKSLDFRISKFVFLVFGEINIKARLGAVCCCDKTTAATVAVVEDSDIIVAKEEGKQSKQASKQESTLKS